MENMGYKLGSSIGSSYMRKPSCVVSNIAFGLVTYGDIYEELQIEDNDGLLEEDGEQHESNINDDE